MTGDQGKLGIEHFARKGIVTRGVLLDIDRFLREKGTPLEMDSSDMITKDQLDACMRAQKMEVRRGDILLIHTGWLRWYLEEATPEQRQRMGGDAEAGALRAPGVGPAEEMAEYLWNLHVAAVASDNTSVEAWPATQQTGFMHFRLIPLLGMPMGELWYLQDLAADCAEDGAYEFMLTSAPLHVPGGVGSPPNALAIK